MKPLEDSIVIICGIVRDCGKALKRNIPTLNKLCDIAREYYVILYENDSTDDTREILTNWTNERKNVFVSMNNIDKKGSVPSIGETNANPFFSSIRIKKMSFYRNKYLQEITERNISSDYILVVDLDVIQIDFDGLLTSFTKVKEWDAVTAYGYLQFGFFTRLYYDTYALTELGMENIPQTRNIIKQNKSKYKNLKASCPWIPVFSAYGGLSIYRYEALMGLQYEAIPNDDKYVESRCEHYSIYEKMRYRGYDKIYINPAMKIKYQNISFLKIPVYLARRLWKNHA